MQMAYYWNIAIYFNGKFCCIAAVEVFSSMPRVTTVCEGAHCYAITAVITAVYCLAASSQSIVRVSSAARSIACSSGAVLY
jgi:hypothetical protein